MKKNKHIAIFLPSFLGGGVERMMVYLANNFSSKGYRVDLVVLKNHGPYKKLLSERVNLIDLKKKRVLFSIFSLAAYLRQNRPDVMLAAMNYVNVSAYFAHLFSFTKTRLVISERDIASKGVKKHKLGFIFKNLIKFIYPRTYKIIAISKDVGEDLIANFKIPRDKVVVINNMVDINLTTQLNQTQKQQLYVQCFDDSKYSSPIIISIGRLVPYKNFSYLINAFSMLSGTNSDVKLIILGEGPERQTLEKLILDLDLQERVKLMGFQDNPREFMQISSVFVSSSTHEGFGNVIIEAMAEGLPIIVTDCLGGPKEIVDYGKYGEIVPLDNEKELASRINMLLQTEYDSNLSIGRAKQFSIENISQEYLNVLLNDE